MIVTITFVCLDLLILHDYLHGWLDTLLAWLTVNPYSGGVVFIGIFIIGSLCFFPVALLSLGAGYVYDSIYGLGLGIFYAFIVCYIGCLLGSAICFARSRFLMRRLIERFATKYPIVRAVDRAFETNGFRIFLLLRLSPALPFNSLNYIGGIMAIGFKQFWWATCIVRARLKKPTKTMGRPSFSDGFGVPLQYQFRGASLPAQTAQTTPTMANFIAAD
jgi:uncharacterized membrane protein YdjX (TVP38/TMEM64 family)